MSSQVLARFRLSTRHFDRSKHTRGASSGAAVAAAEFLLLLGQLRQPRAPLENHQKLLRG